MKMIGILMNNFTIILKMPKDLLQFFKDISFDTFVKDSAINFKIDLMKFSLIFFKRLKYLP